MQIFKSTNLIEKQCAEYASLVILLIGHYDLHQLHLQITPFRWFLYDALALYWGRVSFRRFFGGFLTCYWVMKLFRWLFRGIGYKSIQQIVVNRAYLPIFYWNVANTTACPYPTILQAFISCHNSTLSNTFFTSWIF